MRDEMHNIHKLDAFALVLICVGGLNWLLVGAFQWDLVANTLGRLSELLTRLVYIVVGLAAIYSAFRIPAMSHYRLEPTEGRPAAV